MYIKCAHIKWTDFLISQELKDLDMCMMLWLSEQRKSDITLGQSYSNHC